MDNPVLVEVLRGSNVESRHRGALIVVDGDGKIVRSLGDIDQPIFPRSAIKALQALPLIESGAADRFGLDEAEIALACASHSGEPVHAETAKRMLAKAGLESACLECGVQWPMGEKASRALAAAGETPSALHNNCSGKHAGFLCLACEIGVETVGYVKSEHPIQERIRKTLEEISGAPHRPERAGIDGCSIPTYAIPLRAMALAFARFGTGHGLSPGRAAAARRIRQAVAKHPFMVGGTERFDTLLMSALKEKAFVKVGAEGVYCATFPELGYGVALKMDDGAVRGAEAVMASLALRFLPLSEEERQAVSELQSPKMTNWNGIEVGRVKPAAVLRA